MAKAFSRTKGICTLLLFLFAVFIAFPLPAAAPPVKFELPTDDSVSNVLPPDLISSPYHRVRDKVNSYGYMHHFVVDSDFGVYDVTGDFALRKLVREIWAMASLQQYKKSDAYMQGLKRAASQPVQFGANLVTDPVDTINGIPKGVSRLFDNIKSSMSNKQNPGEDSRAAQALAMSSNKRDLASRLGVDPYSSNKELQKELNGLAWATTLGSLTVSAALAPVGGPAIAAISVTRVAQQVTDIVKEYPPARVREINQDKLLAMGIPSTLAGQFLDQPSYSPTHQTIITSSLEALGAARGREAFLQSALTADDEESANFFQNMAQLMSGYHQKVSTIQTISAYGPMIFARTDSGVVLIPFPLDHGLWTQRAAERIPPVIAEFKAANRDCKKFDAWVTGTVSKLAHDEMLKLGVQVTEKADRRIEFLYY